VSLLVTGVLVASGVLLGRWIARGGRPSAEAGSAAQDGGAAKAEASEEATSVSEAKKTRKPAAAQRDLFAELPCKLGDVVMRTGGDEAWLAGAVVFREDHPVSALFVAPDAGKDRAIYARARPSGQLVWLEPVAPGEIVLGAEPPTSLEHAGVRYERARRLPVKVERVGSGAPDIGEQVIVAEYGSPGAERLVVVTGSGATRVWAGTALEDGMFEVLPSGASTLEQ
jgi:hypothetical protein